MPDIGWLAPALYAPPEDLRNSGVGATAVHHRYSAHAHRRTEQHKTYVCNH
jgi:hypothetical protein